MILNQVDYDTHIHEDWDRQQKQENYHKSTKMLIQEEISLIRSYITEEDCTFCLLIKSVYPLYLW